MLGVCPGPESVSVDSSVNRPWPFTPHFYLLTEEAVISSEEENSCVKKSLVLISYLFNYSIQRTKFRHLLGQMPSLQVNKAHETEQTAGGCVQDLLQFV